VSSEKRHALQRTLNVGTIVCNLVKGERERIHSHDERHNNKGSLEHDQMRDARDER
jgi:hypothetical protein